MAVIKFKVSKAAGIELKKSMAHHDFDDMPLRIAARRNDDSSFEYQMGFDEAGPGDVMVSSRGIDVIIAEEHQELLHNTELDYVELDDGETNFIFKNPNDPNYVPPENLEDSADASDSTPSPPK